MQRHDSHPIANSFHGPSNRFGRGAIRFGPRHRAQRGAARRKLLIAFGLVAAVLLALPFVASPIVRGKIVSTLEEKLNAKAELEEFSFGLGGGVHLGGLELTAADGRRIASVARLDGEVGVLGALFGSYDAELDVEDFELHLWKDAEGNWNVADLSTSDETAEDDDSSKEVSSSELPNLAARLKAEGGKVVLHGPNGETTLAVQLGANLEDWSEPAPVELRVDVEGPGGKPGGKVRLEGNVSVADRGRRGARGASGSLDLRIDALAMEALEPALQLASELEGAGGMLNGTIALELKEDLALSGDLEILGSDLVLEQAGAQPLRLATVGLNGTATADENGSGAQQLTFASGGILEATYRGTLAPEGDARRIAGRLELESRLDKASELAAAFAPDLRERGLAGTLALGADLSTLLGAATELSGLDAKAELTTSGLRARGADGSDLPLEALEGARVTVDLGADLAAGTLAVRELVAKAGALDLRGNASVANLPGTPAAGDAALRIDASTWDLSADLEALRTDLGKLGVELPADARLAGALAVHLEATGGADAPIQAKGRTTVEGLSVDWPVDSEAGGRFLWNEPKLELTLAADVQAGEAVQANGSLEVASELLSGTLQGGVAQLEGEPSRTRFDAIEGRFTYVPDRLAAAAGALLPGKLSGAEPEDVTLRLDGEATGFAPEELFATAEADLTLGVGRFEKDGLALTGDLVVKVRDGLATTNGDFTANGGTVTLANTLAMTPTAAAAPTLTFGAQAVQANAELSPLLGRVHPAFAAASAVQGGGSGGIGGLIDSSLELSLSGPLTLADLTAASDDPNALFDRLNGKGRFALGQASLKGSSLMGQLANELGVDTDKGLDLEPIEFQIEAGRVSYRKPWQWTIDGTPTKFSGSIGLDRTLSMNWSIPITERLVKKNKLLRSLEGDTLDLPIGGTLSSPQLQVGNLLGDLVSQTAKNELDKVLGGGVGGDGKSADQLLAEADKLWSEGKKVEAAALYKEIREKHKISLVYTLNRDRIKDRAKYKPE